MTKIVENINKINGYNKAVSVLENHFYSYRRHLKILNLYSNSIYSVKYRTMYVSNLLFVQLMHN